MVMVLVKTILLRLHTKRIEGGGTDGMVYLGIGGREFNVDSFDEEEDDLESGSHRHYIFGQPPTPPFPGPNPTGVMSPIYNDPRKPMGLLTDTLDPVYIRFEPKNKDDFWCVEEVEVRVNPVGNTQEKRYAALFGTENFLWLGHGRGKYLALFPVPAGTAAGRARKTRRAIRPGR
jgi:hypothetical protein